MSRDAKITLTWADDDYVFRLGWAELEELQEKCDAGPYVLLTRMHDDTWRMADIAETIRLGLIGGGMEPVAALKRVRTYVKKRVPMENLPFAQAILSAAVVGVEDEKLGEPDAPNPPGSLSTTSPTES